MSSILTLPRRSLANDLWIGERPAALQDLASATKRQLPMTRACTQVVFYNQDIWRAKSVSMDLLGTLFFASSKAVFGAEDLASARGGHARCNSLCLGWEPEGCSQGVVFVASAQE